ncbi:ATP-binding cassette domain-containing protein [Calothrix sp. FACHB-1219]|uniref:ATP-binding cassette domain-containing protein n=1 Tax=unclassified Calothrix TaxID=2619626 RepID=UPI0016865FE3|nr:MULTISPECIES: ATP-binding cassette domain-containing protein [unclassified Calothrix]MBD2205816.1 ATP-binding cassette domain-containing protein [Calothrix sp. FACHB-168]MBD2220645.1 ATP-binding cassette domain-containing protein [Calothrix sp. FACHB-1219]
MVQPPSQSRTVFSSNPFIELNNQGEILYFELKKPQHILGRDPSTSDLLVPQHWEVVSRCQAVLCQEGADYRIYDGDGQKASSNKLYVNHSLITPKEGYCLTHGVEIQIAQNPNQLIQIRYGNPANAHSVTTPAIRAISLKQRSILLGRDPQASLQLDAPTVSRRHATIDTDGQGRYILRDYSTNGVFIDGKQVMGTAVLSNGAKIRIGPFTLVVRDDNLEILDQGDRIRLDAQNILLETNGKRRLDNLSFAIEPGQFVALVGGSGAGKSTLMRTLLGIEKITKGEVQINGEDLQKNFNLYRTQIGYVPQDDIIHRELTVAEVLTYAAKLRLPPDIQLQPLVEQALEAIKMTHRRHALVSDLSGGQRKRVSIGVELLADPKLFFLDEPTSGLDPGLDKQMMQLLKDLAHQGGRTIILVTHATANITECDRIVFLGLGGRLCYFGTPQEALKFFGVSDFADIYIKLEQEQAVVNYATLFQQSPFYQRYIGNQINTVTPQPSKSLAPTRKKVSFLQQWFLLTQRYWQLILRDRVNLLLSLLTAPIGIGLITLAIKDKIPFVLGAEPDPKLAPLALQVLFVFTCAALWVGLSSSLQEIVKEAAIYLRERLVNLGLLAYLSSKVTILSILAIAQTLLMLIVILVGFKSPSSELIFWPIGLAITTFLTLLASFSLGLLISACVKNSSQANSALPLLLLPQIIFSGVLFKTTGDLNKTLSWLMLSRWSVGAYGALVNVNGLVPEPTKLPDGSTVPQPFEPTAVYEATWGNLHLNWGFLLLHAAIYLTITFWLQKRKDIF